MCYAPANSQTSSSISQCLCIDKKSIIFIDDLTNNLYFLIIYVEVLFYLRFYKALAKKKSFFFCVETIIWTISFDFIPCPPLLFRKIF